MLSLIPGYTPVVVTQRCLYYLLNLDALCCHFSHQKWNNISFVGVIGLRIHCGVTSKMVFHIILHIDPNGAAVFLLHTNLCRRWVPRSNWTLHIILTWCPYIFRSLKRWTMERPQVRIWIILSGLHWIAWRCKLFETVTFLSAIFSVQGTEARETTLSFCLNFPF